MTERVWTVRDALDWTVGYLDSKEVDSARLSAEWLLSAATGLTRIELYTQFSRPLSADERTVLRDAVKRRAAGEPLQYVTGEMPFRHIVVRVRPGTFIPRPETEVLVGEVLTCLETADAPEPLVIDACTGSGVVALSVAHEHPTVRVIATELSPDSLEVARENVERLGLTQRVSVLGGDLFEPLPEQLKGSASVVVSNPPYIPSDDVEQLAEEILGYEPHLALDGGQDGLDVARRIMREAVSWLTENGVLLMELDESRAKDAVKEMHRWYEDIRTVSDLVGRDRFVVGTIQPDPVHSGQQT